MSSSNYYTIEKLPNRKQWSLNRYDKDTNTLSPVAYFNSEYAAKVT